MTKSSCLPDALVLLLSSSLFAESGRLTDVGREKHDFENSSFPFVLANKRMEGWDWMEGFKIMNICSLYYLLMILLGTENRCTYYEASTGERSAVGAVWGPSWGGSRVTMQIATELFVFLLFRSRMQQGSQDQRTTPIEDVHLRNVQSQSAAPGGSSPSSLQVPLGHARDSRLPPNNPSYAVSAPGVQIGVPPSVGNGTLGGTSASTSISHNVAIAPARDIRHPTTAATLQSATTPISIGHGQGIGQAAITNQTLLQQKQNVIPIQPAPMTNQPHAQAYANAYMQSHSNSYLRPHIRPNNGSAPGTVPAPAPTNVAFSSKSATQQSTRTWTVPNPLLATNSTSSSTSSPAPPVAYAQQQSQQPSRMVQYQRQQQQQHPQQQQQPLPTPIAMRQQQPLAASQVVTGMHHQNMKQAPQRTANSFNQTPTNRVPTRQRQRVVLSPEAKRALGKAIWSAVLSPEGAIDPELLKGALATGLPKHAILNAARLAREREAAKRRATRTETQPKLAPSPVPPARVPVPAPVYRTTASLQPVQGQIATTQPRPIHASLPPRNQSIQAPSTVTAPTPPLRHTVTAPAPTPPKIAILPAVSASPKVMPRPTAPVQLTVPAPSPAMAQHIAPTPVTVTTTPAPLAAPKVMPPPVASAQPTTVAPPKPTARPKIVVQPTLSTPPKVFLPPKATTNVSTKPTPKPQLMPKPTPQTSSVAPKREQEKSISVGKSLAPAPASQKLSSSSSSSSSKSKGGQNTQKIDAARHAALRQQERSKWRHAQNGIFMVLKGKFLSPPHSLGACVRGQSSPNAIPNNSNTAVPRRTKVSRSLIREAARIQQSLRSVDASGVSSSSSSVPLLDPEKFKRIKIEPKRTIKAMDRMVRKKRQVAAETLNKQYKELSKSIATHQQEFFKFHRQRRADSVRIAKTIRDMFDKESKKKEKDVVAAEKARLAALKANDMDAYSKLLEETKNDRLKFLMDRTETHFSQISTSLLQARNKDGSVTSTGGTASYYASAHLHVEEVRQPGILVGGDLKEYQMSGLQWLVSLYNNKLNGILADEMGLGKTIQAISLVAYLMEFKGNLGPYLVIVPLSTLSNWSNEFQKWCPSAHVICYKGTPAQRKELFKDQVKNGHFNVLLTTYEYIIKDKASLRKITWQYAIVDEGHRMKNSASKFAKTLASQYETNYRLLLTGTPLMNDLGELWSLLNFLLPTIFNSVDTFDQWFNRPFAQFGNTSNDDEANFLTNEERMFIIHRLHELLRPFMLRRVKSEVLDQLPEKVEKVLRCELSSWQKELYKQISYKAVAEQSGGAVQQQTSRGLNNVVMQLRKVCNHPYLFSPLGYQIDQNIVRSSGKMELLDRMLPKLRAAGHRVLMFTQMTAVMSILEDYFAYRGFLSLRLDGSTPAEEREKRMYKFNAPDSPFFIFLLSTRAGGLGLNLTAANTVIIFDSDWNPMMDLQAQDRAHRIGQRSGVSVFRLVTYSPVEEKILSRATEKLNMSELVVEAGQFDKRSVENDNSLERKKMMEVLLTDFDTRAVKPSDDTAAGDSTELPDQDNEGGGGGGDDGDDDGSRGSKEDNLNDLLSNNSNDFQLYESFDKAQAENGETREDLSLFSSHDDVPDWIKNPATKKKASFSETDVLDSGPRKRKEVIYDDGLTDRQFVRLMEKQFDMAETKAKQSKSTGPGRRQAAAARTTGAGAATATAAAPAAPPTGLTDWTFRKLITCSKGVIAMKDPSTNRRLSDIFLEKPSPAQYPDYYELIEKPIAINDILRKCRGKLYQNLTEFVEDWKLMFANAKQFNGEGSWVVEDGKALERELQRVLKKNGLDKDNQTSTSSSSSSAGATPKKKKKLRIKLSLKSIKGPEQDAGAGTTATATREVDEVEEAATSILSSEAEAAAASLDLDAMMMTSTIMDTMTTTTTASPSGFSNSTNNNDTTNSGTVTGRGRTKRRRKS